VLDAEFYRGLKVFVALETVDLRKSFNGLEALVGERLARTCGKERSLSLAIGGTRG
jgi:hypothetical protein